jgi:ATP-binding cassette, subfamily B, bacterial
MRSSSRRRFETFRAERPVRGRYANDPRAEHGAVPEDRSTRRRSYLRDYVQWLRPFTRALVVVLVLGAVTAGLGLVLPRATMYIVDHVIPARAWNELHLIGGILLAIIVVQQSLELWRLARIAKLNAQVVFRVRQRLFDHMLHLPLHRLSNLKTGGITSRLSGDVDLLSGLLQQAIISPGVAAIRVVLTLGMLLWINWMMALAAALILPPVVILNLVYIRRIRPIYRSMRHDRQDIDAGVVETFSGIRVVRAFRRENTETKHHAVDHHVVIRKQLLARLLEYIVATGWGFLIPLSGLIVIWVGGALTMRGQASVGGILAFQMYLFMLLGPVSAMVQSYGRTQQALAAMERVFDLLREPIDKPDRPNALAAPRLIARFTFDDVSFGYAPDQLVLSQINLDVPGGATVALVGPSGSGKTTLTNLVARFYDPTHGAIRLNGRDLRDYQLNTYRGLLALVQQDTFLFDGSIAENIAYGNRTASRAEIRDAARRANVLEFVEGFPAGFDTVVGERGVRLSGGQAQRVSIARAILADPAILILDEATSNLDTESEQLIQASLTELLADRTTFVIAHRLSTIMHADLIVVLDQGEIVELGPHAELIARNSRYRDMVERQQRGMLASTEPEWLS